MVIADRSKKRINQQEDMSWYRALTLSERISLWHGNEGRNFSEQEQGELAAQKLQWWKEQEPFNKEGYFAERLAIDGLSEEELSCLLAEPGMSLPEGISERPAWLDRLIQSFTTFDTHASYVLPEIEHAHGIAALLHTVKPLLKNALDQFQGKLYLLVQGQRYLPFEQEMMTSFFMTHLSQLLLWKLSRTMVLELNIARVQERLPGTAPEERFDHFVQQHSQPEVMLALLQRYPVLARQLVLCVDTWQEAVLEFLERLCNDWQEICATFTPEADPGLLVAVSAGAGDAHRRGRSVFILRFNSGFELVYKPRSLAVDIHFQHLLVWVNARSNLPALYCMQLLDKGVYGWSECISSRGCTSPDEVERFYVRQGAYLGLLHALSAVDFHAENLLAAGEHPVLVDLEALFHPHVPRSSAGQSLDPAGETLSSSVLSVGLLPYRMWSNEQKPGIDCSGLGHKSGQIYPQRVPQWSQIGTDQMCLVREYVAFPERQNRPTLHGAEVDLCQYQDAILHGFTQIYRFLMTERDTFLAEIVPLFAHDNIRCILRPTMAYGLLLQDSSHPDVLRDALDLQRYLDRLWIMAEHCPFMKHLIRAECADLLEGDIPYFTARPASKDIWTSRGECIAEFFPEASLDIVKDRITGLNEHDLAQQLWIIQASLTAVSMEGHTGSATRLTPPPTPIVWATPLRLQSAAQAIGNRLCALALHNEERVGWLGITLTNNIEWKIMPAETDFYSGLPGIAFFLAYLGSVTGQAHATQLAQSVARMLKQQLETPSRQSTAGIGAFAGWGAQLYLFSHLYSLWREQWLLDAAAQCVEQITPLIEQDTHLDIISGAAGCIAALLSLYNVAPSSDLMASALRCGEHLVTSLDLSADSDPVTTLRQKGVLTGYAHGASGMALSLLQLASLSREPSFQQAALVLLAFEHSLFSAQHQNWPDLRDISKYFPGDEAQRFMTAWCHGAPGIGMSRLAMLNYLDNSKIRQEIDAALHTTLKAGFGRNHSLCHGDLGNLELLLTATRHPGMAHYEPLLTRHTTRLLASGETSGWITGIPLGVETPGMMVGLSGIGYQLLRLSAPERVPNVLLLSPPVITELGQNSPIHKVRRRSFSPYPFLGAPSEV